MAKTALLALLVCVLAAASTATAAAQTNPVLCDGIEATIVGTPGDDFLQGTDGPDVIAALQGNDTVFGADGDDIICGGIGDDVLLGGQGFDIIFGAQGNDDIAGGWTLETRITPQALIDDVRGARVFGGQGDDRIWGTNRWDRMQGGPGDDVLWGFQGVDRLRGGPGNDIIYGHQGADDLGGGNGNDQMFADNRDVVVRSGAGNDACPTVTQRATTWFGCRTSFQTSSTDPGQPASPFPSNLDGGPEDAWVVGQFQIFRFNVDPFITVNIARANAAGEFATAESFIHFEPLNDGQARAVAESIRLDSAITAVVPFIPLNNPDYIEAVEWGRRYLELNPRIVER